MSISYEQAMDMYYRKVVPVQKPPLTGREYDKWYTEQTLEQDEVLKVEEQYRNRPKD